MKYGIFFVVMLSLVRCVTFPYEPQAREVKRKPTVGGTIALNMHHRQEDRARADIMMKSNCGNSDVKVVEEGEVVVGERQEATTDRHATQSNGFTIGAITFGNDRPVDRTTTHTVQVKEWQISYDCVAAAPSQAAPVAKAKAVKKGRN
ncbi:MAG: hypothetical protein HYR96_08030 [Deltaproteobacteria bacterium]|nr:hypothetical protein [Deltaproteobacteria bacterium]MBI3293456.1 hypothetical protein [Deltaproteobacteria bacterium]